MQKVTLYLITIVIGAVLIFVIGLGTVMYYDFYIAKPTPAYLSQSCEYDLYLSTNFAGDLRINSSDNPVRNITMGIPLPHRNGRPLVLEKELTPELFQQRSVERLKGNTTPPVERSPPFTYSFVVSNGTQMVMIQSSPGTFIR